MEVIMTEVEAYLWLHLPLVGMSEALRDTGLNTVSLYANLCRVLWSQNGYFIDHYDSLNVFRGHIKFSLWTNLRKETYKTELEGLIG